MTMKAIFWFRWIGGAKFMAWGSITLIPGMFVKLFRLLISLSRRRRLPRNGGCEREYVESDQTREWRHAPNRHHRIQRRHLSARKSPHAGMAKIALLVCFVCLFVFLFGIHVTLRNLLQVWTLYCLFVPLFFFSLVKKAALLGQMIAL